MQFMINPGTVHSKSEEILYLQIEVAFGINCHRSGNELEVWAIFSNRCMLSIPSWTGGDGVVLLAFLFENSFSYVFALL